MKLFRKESWPIWIIALIVLILMCFVLLYFSEAQIPTNLTSSGIVAIISAVIGVVLTAFAISIQLKQQSDTEAQKDKDVNIFKKKIEVYSEFTKSMWTMCDKLVSEEKKAKEAIDIEEDFKKLRLVCFNQLVFYLKEDQINDIQKRLHPITTESSSAEIMGAIAEITSILQKDIWNKNAEKNEDDEKSGYFISLFNSFDKTMSDEEQNVVNETLGQVSDDVQYWHFNLFGDEQIDALKKARENGTEMVLNMIEYNESWRTDLMRQVRPNDIVFLLRRGGYGYIGAFEIVGYRIFEFDANGKIEIEETGGGKSEFSVEKFNKDIELNDMYKSREDGATFSSNLIVKPAEDTDLYLDTDGIPSDVVRRRTIQRILDPNVGKSLLEKFKDASKRM